MRNEVLIISEEEREAQENSSRYRVMENLSQGKFLKETRAVDER